MMPNPDLPNVRPHLLYIPEELELVLHGIIGPGMNREEFQFLMSRLTDLIKDYYLDEENTRWMDEKDHEKIWGLTNKLLEAVESL